MRWLDGRQLAKGFRPVHARAWGQVMAQLHEYATVWQPPDRFTRPHWDWEGQLGKDGMLWDYPIEEMVASMPTQYQEPFKADVSFESHSTIQLGGQEIEDSIKIEKDHPSHILLPVIPDPVYGKGDAE